MTTLRDIAEAICLEQFGSEEYHGEARCCKAGGTEGCCAATYETTAQVVLDVLAYKKRDPSWQWLRALSKKIIPSKKGMSGYKRKPKHLKETN